MPFHMLQICCFTCLFHFALLCTGSVCCSCYCYFKW